MKSATLQALMRPLCSRSGLRVLRAYQNHALRRTLAFASANSPFYRRKFAELGADPDRVHAIEDLPRLGFFTTPADLARDPFDFLAVPKTEACHITSTSGTTGLPKIAFYTQREWKDIINRTSLAMTLLGMGPEDVVHILLCAGTPAWASGTVLQESFGRLGSLIVATGNALTPRQQIESMQRYGVTRIYATPSYLHRVTEEGRQIADLGALGVKGIYLGAEPNSQQFRDYIEGVWRADAYDGYGMMEMGLGIAGQCLAKADMHVDGNLAVEVIDPQTGEVLPPGQVGELVFTTLNRRATPLLRYRSGDMASLHPYDEPCSCGVSPAPLMSHVMGRSDDLTFLGTGENFAPAMLDQVFVGMDAVTGYQLIIDKDGYKDLLTLRVETHSPSNELERQIVAAAYERVPFLDHDVHRSQTIADPMVAFIAPGTLLAEHPVKVRRIVDRRGVAGYGAAPTV